MKVTLYYPSKSWLAAILGVSISMMLLEPTYSAVADSFQVTTSKNVYSSGQRVVVIGIVPQTSDNTAQVKISLMRPDGQACGPSVYSTPNAGGDFVSRPIPIASCGEGNFTVIASYANLTDSTAFEVSAPAPQRGSMSADLQKIFVDVSTLDSKVGARIRHLADSDQAVPQEILTKYQQAKLEASSAIEELAVGHWDGAKSHGQAALASFEQIANELHPDNTPASQLGNSAASMGQVSTKPLPLNEMPIVADGITSVDSLSHRLQKLAASNDVDDPQLFGLASTAIQKARNLLASGDTTGARENLQLARMLLSHVQADLRDHAQQKNLNSTLAAGAGSPASTVNQRLLAAADRIQRSDTALMAQNVSDPAVHAEIQGSLSSLQAARADIDKGNFIQAREHLSDALSSMYKAKAAISELQSHNDLQTRLRGDKNQGH